MNNNNYYPGMEFETPSNTGTKTVSEVKDFNNFTAAVLGQDEVLIKFEAGWCMPCKAMSPIVEDFASKHPDIKVLAVDIEGDGFDELLSEYKVMSLPTFIYLKDGKVAGTAYGTNTRTELHTLVSNG